MTNPKLQTNSNKAISYKPQANSGYAAMFSFLVMMVVLGTLFSVFSILVLKGVFLSRTSVIEFKNIYAAEALVEDTIIRITNGNIGDAANLEILDVGDSIVSTSFSSEDSIKSYVFSSKINDKYYSNISLKVEGSDATTKIKRWQDIP